MSASSQEQTVSSPELSPAPASGIPGASLPAYNYETLVSPTSAIGPVQICRDVWRFRELLGAFILRDVKVRYKQTALGVIWVVLQPLLAGGLFAKVFSDLGSLSDQTSGEKFLFFLAGFVPWTTFSSAVQLSSASMEINSNLVRKVYFPRILLPGAYVLGSVIDYCIALIVLLIAAAAVGHFSPLVLVLAPALLLVQLLTAGGVGLVLASLNAQYHDVKYAIPFVLFVGLTVTVFLPLDNWGPSMTQILSFNPMTLVIEIYRSVLTGESPAIGLVALSLRGSFASVVIFLGGVWFFRQRESMLADIL